MKTDKRIFRTALCLILAAVLGCSSAAFADPGDPGFLMETQTDLNGDGTPERLELFETSSGKTEREPAGRGLRSPDQLKAHPLSAKMTA